MRWRAGDPERCINAINRSSLAEVACGLSARAAAQWRGLGRWVDAGLVDVDFAAPKMLPRVAVVKRGVGAAFLR